MGNFDKVIDRAILILDVRHTLHSDEGTFRKDKESEIRKKREGKEHVSRN